MADGGSAPLASSLADGANPLPGYVRRKTDDGEVVAANFVIEELLGIIATHGTLYAWAKRQPQSQALRGRAPVYVANVPDREATTVVIRHVWHGGLLAPVTGDRFRRPTRAPHELLRSYMLRQRGIPTPELVGFALYNAGPGLARVDVATRYVPESSDFATVLARLSPDVSRDEAFVAVEVLMRQLAENGFTHPDLNIKNILLHKRGGDAIASVLDVDVMQWNPDIAPATAMRLNIERLVRSLVKARRQFGIDFPDAERNAFEHRMLQR